ncbi:thioredoxin family protein [Nakamurella lactea]|uniref:thioredoxin family protein n=1 Tax=Nakamurella lactea TaxID=459515 RepID=UPI00041FD637|nr:thioredoxin domain-containing protein [Nakamurella lactea]
MTAHAPPTGVSLVTAADFEAQVLNSPRPVLVEFGADWCPPCRVIEPVLAAIAADRADTLRVVTVDADDDPEIAGRYGILGLPTLMVFTGGIPVMQVTGARSKTRLTAEIDAALAG